MAKNRLDYKADLGRHSHDVHAGFTSQLTPGPIVPQYFDILGPGDTIYYKTHMFARFQPLVTAFLGEVDINVDYFFVPLQMLYLPFGSVFANTNDYISSVFKNFDRGVPQLNIMNSLNSATTDVHGFFQGHQECMGKEVARLFDALDMNPFVVLSNTATGYSPSTRPEASIPDNMCYVRNCMPWALFAYQAAYQLYYRNDELETFNVQAYNIDQYYNLPNFDNLEACKLRYVQRPSDYFTDIRVSPIFSAVNALGHNWPSQDLFPENGGDPKNGGATNANNLFKVLNYLGAGGADLVNLPQKFGSEYTSVPDDQAQNSFENVGATQIATVGSSESFLNASNIRALFALDKYQRIFGRAKKTYDDQILAHFGIKIPHDVKHDITHLKHYRMVLQADTVVANSAYEDLKLGQIGGQGSAVMDTDGEKFTAPVHGVFLAVAYAVTKPRYQLTFSKLHFKLSPIHFPQPEFDKLGAQPVYAFEFNPLGLNDQYISVRIGWQNRYQEFKEKYNRASISYMGTNTLYGSKLNNVYAPWVLSQQPYFNYGFSGTQQLENKFINPTVLFESPHSLDNVMVTPYDGYWNNAWLQNPHLMFQTDPIITDFMCSAKKVSWMSPTGEPDL